MWLERRTKSKAKELDARSPFDIDYARVVHSASFRRLQGKTQILNLGDSDFYRTRLTHSLEVAQVAAGIIGHLRAYHAAHPAASFLPESNLIQAIGFTHDLGHPPFGHGGEVALNYCMRNAGGFEGNGQTLRILSRLECFSEQHGANLTRRSLLGVLKYPVSYETVRNPDIQPRLADFPSLIRTIDRDASKPPKCFLDTEQDVVDWILEPLSANDRAAFQRLETIPGKHRKPLHKSFDCSIMDLADDIAYGVHDLEDAIALKLLSREDFEELISAEISAAFLHDLARCGRYAVNSDPYGFFLTGLFGDAGLRKRLIGELVHYFIKNAQIIELAEFSEPLLRYRVRLPAEQRLFLDALGKLVWTRVIRSPQVQQLEFKGQQMVVSVFEALQSDPKTLLPVEVYKSYEASNNKLRIICDYVAAMTDGALLKIYDRLFSPRMGSVFDRL